MSHYFHLGLCHYSHDHKCAGSMSGKHKHRLILSVWTNNQCCQKDSSCSGNVNCFSVTHWTSLKGLGIITALQLTLLQGAFRRACICCGWTFGFSCFREHWLWQSIVDDATMPSGNSVVRFSLEHFLTLFYVLACDRFSVPTNDKVNWNIQKMGEYSFHA